MNHFIFATEPWEFGTSNDVIHLSFHWGNHFNRLTRLGDHSNRPTPYNNIDNNFQDMLHAFDQDFGCNEDSNDKEMQNTHANAGEYKIIWSFISMHIDSTLINSSHRRNIIYENK